MQAPPTPLYDPRQQTGTANPIIFSWRKHEADTGSETDTW